MGRWGEQSLSTYLGRPSLSPSPRLPVSPSLHFSIGSSARPLQSRIEPS
jgi:hypothetical protein